jgi:hypothetical protein
MKSLVTRAKGINDLMLSTVTFTCDSLWKGELYGSGPDGCGGSCGYCGSDMECVNGSCVSQTLPPNDMSDSVINSPASDTGNGGSFVIDDCPPGQILKYGTCITPPPSDAYVSPSPPDNGGCHTNNKPMSHWWLLLWIGIMAFYIFLRANKGDAND